MHIPRRSNEEIYFHEREQELIQATRKQLEAQALAAERASHRGKCPHCGSSLRMEQFHHVGVDRCPQCHGIWLDADMIDRVVAHEDNSLLTRVFRDLVESMGQRTRS